MAGVAWVTNVAKVNSTADGRLRVRGGRAFYFFGALGAILYGFDTGIIGGAMLFLKTEWHVSPTSEALITSMILAGAMIGSLSGGPIADRFGRRFVVLVCSVIFVLGSLGAAFAPEEITLVIARTVLGLAVGGAAVIVPLYLAEMAPTRIRGAVASLNQTLIILGVGLASLTNFLLQADAAWRTAFGLGVVPAVLMLIGIAFMPETPRWLVRRGRPSDAMTVLRITRDSAEAEAELAEIERVERTGSSKAGLGQILRTPWIRRLLLLGVALAIGQQLGGINTLVYYTPKILTTIGLEQSDSLLFGVLNTVPNLIAVLVAIWIVDRVGRRPLLLYGAVALCLGMACMGLPQLLGAPHAAQNTLAILGNVVFTVAFSLTWGPVLWVMLSEIFPLAARGTAMGIATVANWIFNFAVTFTLPVFIAAWGTGPVFSMYAVLNLIVVAFVGFFVSETKGRSLEQLETDARGA